MDRSTGALCLLMFVGQLIQCLVVIHGNQTIRKDLRKAVTGCISIVLAGFLGCAIAEGYAGYEQESTRALWECFLILGCTCTILTIGLLVKPKPIKHVWTVDRRRANAR